MLVSEFNYVLPPQRIAHEPLTEREGSRMLRLLRSGGGYQDRSFRDFPELLRAGDLVVFNDTAVIPARLYGRRSGAKAETLSPRNPAARRFLEGQVEVLLTRQVSEEPNEWECLVHPGKKIGVGERLFLGASDQLVAEVLSRSGFGERLVRFEPVPDFFTLLEQLGHIPLPPYIRREDHGLDRERYQTVYARERGSVAAPTAGLHFTAGILNRLKERGIETAEVTLHVGLGTFQPLRGERVEGHRLHRESYNIPALTAAKVNRALDESRRVVAVGTTTVRTLEQTARASGRIVAGQGDADLFIYPGFHFRVT
ncbi:MAG: tRNA preQ1(34) S-adenosylmethionine ribosyltransferase-isomerase QueA, partial [Acidobacteria bacterium]|nr:tRNA preQ1(34) S-adenosylmethionine ribosyltransferase-isomerase QueA [Acidobacteriota bacterium]